MHFVRSSSLVSLAAVLALGLGAAPRPAAAGFCKDSGLSKQCVVRGDVEKDSVKSGQVKNNSLSGKDVKDKSVTGADVRDRSLTGADMKDGSLSGAEVQDGSLAGVDIEDGSLTGADIADGNITNAELADDAVTADDIFSRTLVVSPVGDGSDATLNGDALLDAIGFLNNVKPLPDATNPWLVKLEAGVYDVGATSVQMLPYVDLEGAGQEATEIKGAVDSNVSGNPGVVNTADNTEVRHVTVTNTGAGILSFAISVSDGAVQISDTTAQGATTGLRARGCSELTLTDVTATGIEGALLACASHAATNLTAIGTTFGITLDGLATTLLRNSVLDGGTSHRLNTGTLSVAHSQVIGPIVPNPMNTWTLNCIGTYDDMLNPVVCP